MPDEQDTGALKAQQIENIKQSRKLAQEAIDDEELAQHKRRAEKADYLREKLEERERSEAAAEAAEAAEAQERPEG